MVLTYFFSNIPTSDEHLFASMQLELMKYILKNTLSISVFINSYNGANVYLIHTDQRRIVACKDLFIDVTMFVFA